MASTHLHSVKLQEGFHHIYNIQFINEDELMVIFNSLNGTPIPVEKQPILDDLKRAISELIMLTRNKNKELNNKPKLGVVGQEVSTNGKSKDKS